MKINKGFTLLELLIVVIIVGILASLAIPRYIKATENSRAAEAYANLNALRQAEWGYYGKMGYYTFDPAHGGSATAFGALKVEDPNDIPTAAFNYQIIAGTLMPPFWVIAFRNAPSTYAGDYITMHANGFINEDHWLNNTGGGSWTEPTIN